MKAMENDQIMIFSPLRCARVSPSTLSGIENLAQADRALSPLTTFILLYFFNETRSLFLRILLFFLVLQEVRKETNHEIKVY